MKNIEKKRIILHLDMDYFFAQIEERENPHFKGKPLVVGADPKKGKGRGVVSTCNYEAREYGIRSGMAISRAYSLCPTAIFLPVNMSLYKRISISVFKIIKKSFSKYEKVSLDEAYIDITEKVNNFKSAEIKGDTLRDEIYKREKLRSSVGISGNKMMAKIACELAKPNGIKVILPKNSKKIISKMGVEVVPGIGPKTKKIIGRKLDKKEPRVKDANTLSKRELKEMLGKRGEDFYCMFRGIDHSPVEEKREIKSIGREHTFQEDTRDSAKIIETFKKIVNEVFEEAKNKKIKGITVVCRFEDFQTRTRQISFDAKRYDNDFYYKKGISLLLGLLTENNKKIRLVGFRVRV